MLVEVIVTNVEEAITAEKYGANRLELIHAFDLGGLSPRLELSKEVCSAVSIPVNVMVRPHGHSFLYDIKDMQTILLEIDYLITHTEVNDIVFGALNEKNEVAFGQLEIIIKHIEKTKHGITFHRAIDESKDVFTAFRELHNYKEFVKRALTSGGKETAMEGIDTIFQMQHFAENEGITVLAGSGIKPENARDLISKTRVKEIHLGTGLRTNGKLDQAKFVKLNENIN